MYLHAMILIWMLVTFMKMTVMIISVVRLF